MNAEAEREETESLRAFEAVVAAYEGALLRYASHLVYNVDAAQDIVQNTFLRLFRNWREKMEPSAQIATWLYRVAHNCAVDHMRKEARLRLLHMSQAGERPSFLGPDRGADFAVSEKAEKAVDALKVLSHREQELVVLKVFEEKSYKEISEIAGLTVTNVGYILHNAMKKMAAHLKQAGKS